MRDCGGPGAEGTYTATLCHRCSKHGDRLAAAWLEAHEMCCRVVLLDCSKCKVCTPAVPLGLQVYQPSLDQVEALPLGREQDVTVLGIAFDTQAQVTQLHAIANLCTAGTFCLSAAA